MVTATLDPEIMAAITEINNLNAGVGRPDGDKQNYLSYIAQKRVDLAALIVRNDLIIDANRAEEQALREAAAAAAAEANSPDDHTVLMAVVDVLAIDLETL
jgi:hypothetical protein